MNYLVKLREGTGRERELGLMKTEQVKGLEASGAKVKRQYKHINIVAVEIDEKDVGKLIGNPDVISIEVDGEVHALDEYSEAWGVTQVGALEVHQQGIKGQAVKVAVIDTGIDYTHFELANYYKGGFDFVNNDTDPKDDNGHGTHCAGIIAAALNGVGVVGMAPSVSLYALKVLDSAGSGVWSAVIAALDWCIDNGIQITSNSYGGLTGSTLMYEAFLAAWRAGILSIAAAGNNDGDGTADTVGYPAKYDVVVAVAATDINKARATFSSTGPEVEVSAPGVNVYSTLPGNTYGAKSGTSMACPHVAGLAALVKSAHPDWDRETIRGQMRASAENLGVAGHDWLTGFGLINAPFACGQLIPNPPPMPPTPPPVLLPEIAMYMPTDIGGDYALLDGELLAMGSATSVTAQFYYGPYTPPVTYLKPTPWIVMLGPGKYSYKVTGLQPNTQYEANAVGLTNSGQYVYGSKVYFTTKAAPVPPPPPPPPPSVSMWVKSITFVEKGKNLQIPVSVVRLDSIVDSGLPLAGAWVETQINGPTLKGPQRTYTNTQGIATFKVNKAPLGTYVVTITALTYLNYTWDKTKGVTSETYVHASATGCALFKKIKEILKRGS